MHNLYQKDVGATPTSDEKPTASWCKYTKYLFGFTWHLPLSPRFSFFFPLIIRSLCFIRSTSYSPYLWYLLPTTSLSCELELNTSSHRYLSVNLQRQCDGVKITTVSFFFATVNLRWQRMDFIWIGLISICSKRISASVQGYIEIENRSCRERIEMSNIYFTECPSIAIFFFCFFSRLEMSEFIPFLLLTNYV